MTHLEIEAFLAVTESRNITKSAADLKISQSALSRRIKVLENELGYLLFIRQQGVRAVTLTEQGQKFVPLAQEWMAIWRKAQKLVLEQNHQSDLRISITDSLSCVAPAVTRLFLQKNPSYCCTVSSRRSTDSYDAIINNNADLAFVLTLPENIQSDGVLAKPLYSEDFCYVGCKPEGLRNGPVPSSILDSRKYLMVNWSVEHVAWYNQLFGNVTPFCHVNTIAFLMNYTFCDGEWTIAPATVTRHIAQTGNIFIADLQTPPKPRTVHYLENSGYQRPEVIRSFLESCRECLKTYPGVRVYEPSD